MENRSDLKAALSDLANDSRTCDLSRRDLLAGASALGAMVLAAQAAHAGSQPGDLRQSVLGANPSCGFRCPVPTSWLTLTSRGARGQPCTLLPAFEPWL